MKAKGHIVWFFRQKKGLLECKPEWNREAITVFSRLPSLRRLQATPPLQTSLVLGGFRQPCKFALILLNQSRMFRKYVFFIGIQTMVPPDFFHNHSNWAFGMPNFTQNWQRLVYKGLTYPLNIAWKFIHSGFMLLIVMDVEVVTLKLES